MSTDTMIEEELVPFSKQIWQGTAGEHGSAESSGFMSDLVKGRLPRAGYLAMHRQMYFLYRAIEEQIDRLADHPVVGPFRYEELTRTLSIESDILALGGTIPTESEMNEATASYCDRITTVASEWAPGLVAHHYTRYLGDLSGGQHIRRVVEKTYGIDRNSGSAFYHFAGISDPVEFKKEYRATLDRMPLDRLERKRFIAEVVASYRLSTLMVEAMDATEDPNS